MSQSKRMSLVEALTGTLVGLLLAFVVNAFMMHLTGVTASAAQNFVIVAGHTVVSMIRQYALRRFFNYLPQLQAWWVVRRPDVIKFIDKVLELYARGRSGRRW